MYEGDKAVSYTHLDVYKRQVHLYVAHTNRDEDAQAFADEVRAHFGTDDVYVDRLPLSIACHVGPGALGIGCAKKQFA